MNGHNMAPSSLISMRDLNRYWFNWMVAFKFSAEIKYTILFSKVSHIYSACNVQLCTRHTALCIICEFCMLLCLLQHY